MQTNSQNCLVRKSFVIHVNILFGCTVSLLHCVHLKETYCRLLLKMMMMENIMTRCWSPIQETEALTEDEKETEEAPMHEEELSKGRQIAGAKIDYVTMRN